MRATGRNRPSEAQNGADTQAEPRGRPALARGHLVVPSAHTAQRLLLALFGEEVIPGHSGAAVLVNELVGVLLAAQDQIPETKL